MKPDYIRVPRGFGTDGWRMREYTRMRGLGWTASAAWEAAKVREKFYTLLEEGRVRIECTPDEDFWEDTFDRDAYSEKEWSSIESRIEGEGYWVYSIEVRSARVSEADPAKFEHCTSCGGFIGDDWFDGGYDISMMAEALDRVAEIVMVESESRRLVDEINSPIGRLSQDALRLVMEVLELSDIAADKRIAMALAAAKNRAV